MAPTGGAIEVPAVKKPRVDCDALEPGALQKGLTFWDKRLLAATAAPISVKPYVEGTYKRRARVRRIFDLLKHVGPEGIISAMATVYKASTALTYAQTMTAEIPGLKKHRAWGEALLWLMKHKAQEQTTQAIPITPIQMRELVTKAKTLELKAALTTMWVSASRYGDLEHFRVVQVWPRGNMCVVKAQLPVWKSDPTGRRHCSKVYILPSHFLNAFRNRIPTYAQTLLTIKNTFPDLSCHSIRRGAITSLGHNYTGEEIIALTQHTLPCEPIAIRLYTATHTQTQENQTQLKLSTHLWELIS